MRRYGFTQDLSGRGVFFYTDFQVTEGDAVELTLVMPSEITLTENARVRCRGRVVRVTPVEQKFGVAARLEGYEYLPKAETAAQVSANFPRISTVHNVTSDGQKPAHTISVAAGISTSTPWLRVGAQLQRLCMSLRLARLTLERPVLMRPVRESLNSGFAHPGS